MQIFQAASEFLPMIDEVKEKEKEKSSSIYLARSRYSQCSAMWCRCLDCSSIRLGGLTARELKTTNSACRCTTAMLTRRWKILNLLKTRCGMENHAGTSRWHVHRFTASDEFEFFFLVQGLGARCTVHRRRPESLPSPPTESWTKGCIAPPDNLLLLRAGDETNCWEMQVLEVRPMVDWNKGKAVEFLLDSLGLADSDEVLPIYIGDDRTDEDAFKVRGQFGSFLVMLDNGLRCFKTCRFYGETNGVWGFWCHLYRRNLRRCTPCWIHLR